MQLHQPLKAKKAQQMEHYTMGANPSTRIWIFIARWCGSGRFKKGKLDHDYTIAGFALAVSLAVGGHFERGCTSNGNRSDALEQVVWKLHKLPTPDTKTLEILEDTTVDMFWTDFEDFQKCQNAFDQPSPFWLEDVIKGRSQYLWPYTKVLVLVCCSISPT